MSIVMVTVGPAASGKTTYAHQWCEQNNAILTDSDSVREDLYGDASCQRDPSKVFKVMMDDVLAALGSGKNVCYCATNLSSKRRINFISNVRKYYPNTKFVCVVCSAPPEICIAADRKRERQVRRTLFGGTSNNFNVLIMEKVGIVLKCGIRFHMMLRNIMIS